MLSSRAELLSKREQREKFHFAESSKESHCKTRLELATPALTSNAVSLSFGGKVALYQLSYQTTVIKQKKTAKCCPHERKTRLELATPTLARLCSTN